MKKIAIDARFLLRVQRGMPLYVTTLCKLMPRKMENVHFYILINTAFEHNENKNEYQARLEAIKKASNVTIVDIQTDDELSWELKKLPAWLKINQPNLLHMPTNRVCLLTKIKQIATFHDCMEWTFLNKIHAIPERAGLKLKLYFYKKRFYVWLIYQLGLRKLDSVLTISNYAQKSLTQHFSFIKNKISYVYHGIPMGFSSSNTPLPFEEREGVLMLGGDSYQKNPENAIKAWNALPEELKIKHPLTIAGFTGNEDSPVMTTIIALGIENQVVIKKWVSDQELISLFSTSAVLLFASREEGFGFPLVQAMACGTPIVTSEAEVLREIGGEAVLTAPAENPELLSDQVESLLTDQERWILYQNLGLTRAEIFTWESACNAISTKYSELINE